MNSERNESTSATCPRHIWMHEVACEALSQLRARYNDNVSVYSNMLREPEMRARLNRWYTTGEPIWMAADGLRMMLRDTFVARRAERDGSFSVAR